MQIVCIVLVVCGVELLFLGTILSEVTSGIDCRCHMSSEVINARGLSELTLATLALRSVRSCTSRAVHSLFAQDFRSGHEPVFEHRQLHFNIPTCSSSSDWVLTYMPPAYPPRPRIPSA